MGCGAKLHGLDTAANAGAGRERLRSNNVSIMSINVLASMGARGHAHGR